MGVLGIIPVDFCWFGGWFEGLVKIDYMLILMECVLDLCFFYLFLVIDRLLQAYQIFLIAYQQVSDRNLASKIFLSVLLSDVLYLSWLSRFSLFEVYLYLGF